MRKRKTTAEFIEQARAIHGDKYDYSKTDYKGAKNKVCIICNEVDEFGKVHGEFQQTPDNHVNSRQGCPKCARNVPLTTQEFIAKAKLVHGNLYDYSKVNYVNYFTNVTIICQEHGEFEQLPSNHLRNEGCPKCSQSKGEKLIAAILQSMNIEFIEQYQISIDTNINVSGKAFIDFYVPSKNTFIEFNGAQHYIPVDYFGGNVQFNKQIQRDNYIKKYCAINNIKLIEIKYNDNINIKLNEL